MLQKLESIRGRSNTLATASSQKLHSWIERLFALVLFRWLYVLLARVFDLAAQVLSRIVRAQKLARCKRKLKQAKTYDQWKRVATKLDDLQGWTTWKEVKECALYDYQSLEHRLNTQRGLSSIKDSHALLLHLRSNLRRKMAGIENPRLYQCNIGTKHLISDYIQEVVHQLRAVCDQEFADYFGTDPIENLNKKFQYFEEVQHAFGRTALLLSGGASLGMYHFGVIKALHEHKLLPLIISGSSVGSIVASLVCVTPTERLSRLFERGSISMNAFSNKSTSRSMRRKLLRFLKKGVLMDIRVLEDCLRENIGDITFKDAYEKTGRVLNISVNAEKRNDIPQLLNYLTAPNVLVWSAACASCALSGLFEPVKLMAKNSKGELMVYHPSGVRFSDGSIEMDLPHNRLAEMFNVNFFIVSQVNPHVAPFLHGRLDPSASWLSAMKFLVSSEIAHRLHQMAAIGVLPSLLVPLHLLCRQTYEGDVTIIPHITCDALMHVISNPTEEFRERCTKHAERETWPHLSYLECMCAIEIELRRCMEKLVSRSEELTGGKIAVPKHSCLGF